MPLAPENRPALDRWLAQLFDDQDETRFGSGWASGTISVFLGVLSVGAVACFHLPEVLTSPAVRAVYSLSWIRPLVATVIGAAFFLGLLSALLRRRKVLGFTGMGLALLASIMGGASVPVTGVADNGLGLGLDWFLLNVFLLALVFVPMERWVFDTQHCHAVIAQMAHAQRATVLKGEYTPGQMLSIVGHFVFAVGMRLHFLIFAAIQRVPFVALPYASKVTGFLDTLEMPTPPLQQVNAGRLIAHIDRSWDIHADLQARIDRALPSLQERARETNRIAVQLLLERTSSREVVRPEVEA